MHILLVGKFPPLQGGVSVEAFRLVSGLAGRGHTVDVVSDALAAAPHERVPGSLSPLWQRLPPSVRVTFTEVDGRFYKRHPMARPAVSQLTSLALREGARRRPDVILSNFLEPYGVAGTIASDVLGVPHAVAHAGSDIERLMRARDLQHLLWLVLNRATRIITSPGHAAFLRRAGVIPDLLIETPVPAPPWVTASEQREVTADRACLIMGKLSGQRLYDELVTVLDECGAPLTLLGADAWPSERSVLPAPRSVARKDFVWPWEVLPALLSASVLLALEPDRLELAGHMGRVALEGLAAGCVVAVAPRVATNYGIPLHACITSINGLREALMRPLKLESIRRAGIAWWQDEIAGGGSAIVTNDHYHDLVERILKEVASSGRQGGPRLPPQGAPEYQPAVASWDSAERGEAVLDMLATRRVPLAYRRHGNRYLLTATSAGAHGHEHEVSDKVFHILLRCDGSETVRSVFGSSRRSVQLLRQLRARGIISVARDEAPFEEVPALVEGVTLQ